MRERPPVYTDLYAIDPSLERRLDVQQPIQAKLHTGGLRPWLDGDVLDFALEPRAAGFITLRGKPKRGSGVWFRRRNGALFGEWHPGLTPWRAWREHSRKPFEEQTSERVGTSGLSS